MGCFLSSKLPEIEEVYLFSITGEKKYYFFVKAGKSIKIVLCRF
jgi:hypothetical protein